jgi:uncharacterized protein YbjQ (UPF0145 family)
VGEPHQVHRNIHFQVAQLISDLLVALTARIDKAPEAGLERLAHRALALGAE